MKTIILFLSLSQVLFLQANGASSKAQNGSLDFLVIGDWGGLPYFPYRTPIESAVASGLAKYADNHNIKFVLALGDNFYFDGVKSVEDPRFQETYNHVYEYDSLDVDWFFVAGNHDHNGNVSAQIEFSKLMKRWNYPDYYYTLSFTIPQTSSTIDIIMIDTVLLCGNSDSDYLGKQPEGADDEEEASTQWEWLEQAISSSKADYLIVAGHYPVWSIAEHGPTKLLLQRLMPMLHKYKATSYFCGHDHNLQHLQYAESNVTVDYFVSGAANFIDPSLAHKKSVPEGVSRFHWANILGLGGFGHVTATAQEMTFTFADAGGHTLYKQTMLPRQH